MIRNPRWAMVSAVGAILAAEAALFSPSFFKFFCGDSLYFLSHRSADAAHRLEWFFKLDSLFTYRPLTHWVFDCLMYPLSGLDPRGYHVMVLAVNLLTSLLVFFLLRRLVRTPAALTGMFFFSVHSVNFFLTYDATFLPDFLIGVFGVASLVALLEGFQRQAWAWKAASVFFFGLALLAKESAIMLPVGMAVVAALYRRAPGAAWWRRLVAQLPLLVPHLILAAVYLSFQIYLRGGALYPRQSGSYQLASSGLWLKGKYLVWIWNLPADVTRRGWWIVPPAVLLLPALAWMLQRFRTGWRSLRGDLLLCALWAAAALAPVVLIRQVPMKHNLSFSVLAMGVALALCVDREWSSERLLPARWPWFVLPLLASVAFQVRNDLRFSWVGEGSDVAENSLAAVRRAYPVLPRGAALYIIYSTAPGDPSWYFDGGSLFRLFYDDPSLRVLFPASQEPLTSADLEHSEVFTFRLHGNRLYDVTPELLGRLGRTGESLVQRTRDFAVNNRYPWGPGDLQGGAPAWNLLLARQDALRTALVMLPGTQIRYSLKEVPASTSLRFGLTAVSKRSGFASARVAFESEGQTELLFHVFLELDWDSDSWWDVDVPLDRLAGRTGRLVVENDADRAGDTVGWSGLWLAPWTSPRSVEPYGRPIRERGWTPLDHFAEAVTSFDRTEVYPDYDNFQTPNGKPAFLVWLPKIQPSRMSLVTIAGARLRFPVPALPKDAVLQVSTAHGTSLGDGVGGRVYWEHNGSRELLLDQMVPARQSNWTDRDISLARFAGQSGVLCLEASSGPAHSTVGDWLAWARMRIVTGIQ